MIDKEKVLHGLDSCGFHDGIPNICEVTECPYRDNKAYCVHELAHDAGMLISELLKVQGPVRHGRWVEEPDRVQRYHCSECGAVWGVSSKAMRYCPNCGAKMGNCALLDMETEGTNNEAAID